MEGTIKTQKIIAVTSGIILFVVIVALVLRHSGVDLLSSNSTRHGNINSITQDLKADNAYETNETNMGHENDRYRYTAELGDSYTGMAREALSAYTKETRSGSLSDTQLLVAEVSLANEAQSPLLEVGQSIEIPRESVASAVLSAEGKSTVTTTINAPAVSDKRTPSTKTKDYSAQASIGDNFTYIARDAIDKFITANEKPLSHAQRVAAETKVAQAAGWPEVEVGQAVVVDVASIESAIASVANLTTAQQAVWQPFADITDIR